MRKTDRGAQRLKGGPPQTQSLRMQMQRERGGRHGAENREKERVAGRWENPASKSSRVGDREGGDKAFGVGENPGGNRQGGRGGVESPRGTNTAGVEELPWGDETSGVTLEGDRVPGSD